MKAQIELVSSYTMKILQERRERHNYPDSLTANKEPRKIKPKLTKKDTVDKFSGKNIVFIAVNMLDGFGDTGNTIGLLRSIKSKHPNCNYTLIAIVLPEQENTLIKMLSSAKDEAKIIVQKTTDKDTNFGVKFAEIEGPGYLGEISDEIITTLYQADYVMTHSALSPKQIEQISKLLRPEVTWYHVDDFGRKQEELPFYSAPIKSFESGFRGVGISLSEQEQLKCDISAVHENPIIRSQLTAIKAKWEETAVGAWYLKDSSPTLMQDILQVFCLIVNKPNVMAFIPGAASAVNIMLDNPEALETLRTMLSQSGFKELYVNGKLVEQIDESQSFANGFIDNKSKVINICTERFDNHTWQAIRAWSFSPCKLGVFTMTLTAGCGGASFSEIIRSPNAIPVFLAMQPYQQTLMQEFIALILAFDTNIALRYPNFTGFKNLKWLIETFYSIPDPEHKLMSIEDNFKAWKYLTCAQVRLAWGMVNEFIHEHLDTANFFIDLDNPKKYNIKAQENIIGTIIKKQGYNLGFFNESPYYIKNCWIPHIASEMDMKDLLKEECGNKRLANISLHRTRSSTEVLKLR